MANYQTTMKDLLVAVRQQLEAERHAAGMLSGVRQIKRGVLPVKPIYPCITVVPMAEMITSYRSSRGAIVKRDVVVHVLTMDPRGRTGFDQAKDIADTCLTILRGDITATYAGESNAFLAEFGSVAFRNRNPLNGAGLYNVSLQVTYASKEQLPNRATIFSGTLIDNPTATQITAAIRDKLYTKKATTLSSVRSIVAEDWEPAASYPRILVTPMGEQQDPEFAGIDTVMGDYQITIESLVGTARDSSMDFHLGLLEPVKDALQEEAHWGGRAYGAEMGAIHFESVKSSGKSAYQTIVNYHMQSRHKI